MSADAGGDSHMSAEPSDLGGPTRGGNISSRRDLRAVMSAMGCRARGRAMGWQRIKHGGTCFI